MQRLHDRFHRESDIFHKTFLHMSHLHPHLPPAVDGLHEHRQVQKGALFATVSIQKEGI